MYSVIITYSVYGEINMMMMMMIMIYSSFLLVTNFWLVKY